MTTSEYSIGLYSKECSETKFIKIPGRLIQGSMVTAKHTDLPTGKHLISIPLNNKLGKFTISAILDGDQGIIYDLYYYYGFFHLLFTRFFNK